MRWLRLVRRMGMAVALVACSQAAFAIDQGEAMGQCIAFSRTYWPSIGGSFVRCEASSTPKQVWSRGKNQYGQEIVYGGWEWQDQCSLRNSSMPAGDKAAASPMPWPNCVAGCKLQQEHISYNQPGGVKLYGRRNATYLNEPCMPDGTSQNGPIDTRETKEEQPHPSQPECTALGSGQTACAKPNGDHCATSSTGKTFCWKPNETGEKKDGPDAQTKSEAGKPVNPPTHTDPVKEYQRKEGHQQTACINSTCTTYNVTNFGETGAGTAKNSTGDNKPDGTGNTSGNGTPGKGSGSGSGGNEEGEGDSASDSGNCEQPPLCTGDTLKCLHLRYTWKNQCNTAKDEVSGGDDCKAVPTCIGKGCKAQEYASLLQQWRGRCAAEDDRAKLASDAASGAADAAGDNEGDAVADLWKKGPGQDGQGLDRNKLTLGGGELFPSIDIMGTAWAPPAQLYSVLNMIRQLVIAAGALAAMYILFKK